MIKSIIRKSLAKKGPTSLEIRGRETAAGNPDRLGNIYNILLASKGIGRVCVIRRLGGIGDVLMCTPALRQIKADFPECQLTFAIDMHSTGGNLYFELVKNAPFLDHIVDARYVQQSNYDAVVDISSVCIRYEHSGLPVLNRIDIFARACGIPRLDKKCPFYSTEEPERSWATNFFKEYRKQGEKIVILHTASMEGKRCWPIEKYFQIIEAALVDKLPIRFAILDFNHKSETWTQYSNCVDVSFTGLRQMAALIEAADFFIGPDSGPMHLAGALNTKSIVTFGSIPPEARINYYPYHESVRMDALSCIGCWYKPCPYNTRCMKELDSQIVYTKMRKRLDV